MTQKGSVSKSFSVHDEGEVLRGHEKPLRSRIEVYSILYTPPPENPACVEFF